MSSTIIITIMDFFYGLWMVHKVLGFTSCFTIYWACPPVYIITAVIIICLLFGYNFIMHIAGWSYGSDPWWWRSHSCCLETKTDKHVGWYNVQGTVVWYSLPVLTSLILKNLIGKVIEPSLESNTWFHFPGQMQTRYRILVKVLRTDFFTQMENVSKSGMKRKRCRVLD